MFRLALVLSLFAVAYGIETCEEMEPFCTDEGIQVFAAGVGTIAQDGVDYGCLDTRPNPAWYYMIIDQPGDLEVGISGGENVDGKQLDVDFAMWGPFDSYDDAVSKCANFGLGSPIDCSWSSSPTEQANLDNGVSGQVYVLVITNYANEENTISFAKNSGSATTDCTVLDPCMDEPSLTSAYAPTNCAGAQPNDECPIFAADGYRSTVGDLGSAVCSSGVWVWQYDFMVDTAVVDIDEPAEGTCNCGTNTWCSNLIGSYQCNCLTGYDTEDGYNCVDIDECATGENNCGDYSNCVNTDGSFYCECWMGFEWIGGENYNCADINECADASSCPMNSDCVNIDGGWECYCHDGYSGPDCLDINECADQTDECSMYADCINTDGSYDCECWMGYSGDGMDCEEDYVAPSPSASAVATEDCVEEVVSEVNVIFAYIFRGLKVEPDCEDGM